MKILKKCVFICFIVLFFSLVGAVPIMEIEVKPIFYENEMISFNYSFISQQDESITYVANINCPNSAEPLLQMQEIYLISRELFLEKYNYGIVNENIESGMCVASISILEPYYLEITKSFEVSALSEFFFNLIFSKKVFLKNEDIYLDYKSSIEDIEIDAVLKYPSGKQKKIDLPISIKASQVGTYELEITASKEGYKDVNLKEQFGVIKEEAKIGEINFSEEKIIISNNKIEKNVESLFYQVLVGILILIIGLVVWFLVRKRK